MNENNFVNLDYKFENYTKSKFRITQNQTKEDAFVYCDDDLVMSEFMKHHEIKAEKVPFSIKHKVEGDGAYLNENQLTLNYKNQNPLIMTIEQLALAGKHNVYNSMAASLAARIVDVRKETIRESLQDFQNIEHRLEFVASRIVNCSGRRSTMSGPATALHITIRC